MFLGAFAEELMNFHSRPQSGTRPPTCSQGDYQAAFLRDPRAGNVGNRLGASGAHRAQGGHLDHLGEKEALAGLPETSVLHLVLPETCFEALGKPCNPRLRLSERTSRDFRLKGSETVTANTLNTPLLRAGSPQSMSQIRTHLILLTSSRQEGAITSPFCS